MNKFLVVQLLPFFQKMNFLKKKIGYHWNILICDPLFSRSLILARFYLSNHLNQSKFSREDNSSVILKSQLYLCFNNFIYASFIFCHSDNIEPSTCRNTDHKFSMHTFERPTTCSHCSKFLKGIIYQGYRCDKCYLAAHKQCISFTGRCGLKPPQLPARHASPLSDPLVAELPQAVPPLPSDWSWSPAQSSDHGLTDYLWFVGSMGRETAERLLEWQMDGTFLLRIRPQGPTHPNETAYALSLK